MRALPFEDVYFRPKKMDNSKLVREADPRAGSACWTVIGVACLMLAFLGGVLAPSVANTVAGYKLESLRVEAQKLADERRTLELQEAQLLSPGAAGPAGAGTAPRHSVRQPGSAPGE